MVQCQLGRPPAASPTINDRTSVVPYRMQLHHMRLSTSSLTLAVPAPPLPPFFLLLLLAHLLFLLLWLLLVVCPWRPLLPSYRLLPPV
jgi:hypothetical protein